MITISKSRRGAAFTIVELLIVITLIIVLAALTLGTIGYVQKKAARSRAETEIAALSAACESYKADNGIYPTNNDTYALDAKSAGAGDPANYQAASLYLYEALYGVPDAVRSTKPTAKSYFSFKPNMLLPAPPSTADVKAIRDPFGNSYGYSTAGNPGAAPSSGPPSSGQGYNPTFDLWSTAGTTSGSATDRAQWLKNW